MKNNILGVLMGIIIGVILIGSLLAPTIEGVQKTAGEEVTLKNDSDTVLKSIDDGDVFKLTSTRNADSTKTDVWTINDETITNVGGDAFSWTVGLISDAMYVRIQSTNNASSGALMDSTTGAEQYISPGTTEGTYIWTWTFANGVMTYVDRAGTEVTAPYTWGYVACPLEEGEYYSAETDGVGICSSADDLILCGSYTTGSLDTMYAYHNGEKYVSVSSYTMTVNTTTELHDGTTDIYDITVTVDISDGENTENFTPFRIYLPYEVTGHADSGAAYSMYGAIIILAIAALLILGVRIITRRD